jgi:hypothetical protein
MLNLVQIKNCPLDETSKPTILSIGILLTMGKELSIGSKVIRNWDLVSIEKAIFLFLEKWNLTDMIKDQSVSFDFIVKTGSRTPWLRSRITNSLSNVTIAK